MQKLIFQYYPTHTADLGDDPSTVDLSEQAGIEGRVFANISILIHWAATTFVPET